MKAVLHFNVSDAGALRNAWFVVLSPIALGLGALLGCEGPRSDSMTAAPKPPTPEERFTTIVEELEQRVNESSRDQSGAVADYTAPAGTPITSATVEVSHKLNLPSREGEPYRANICLTTRATVTVTLPQKTEEEKEALAERKKAQVAALDTDISGIPDLDSLVVPSTDGIGGRLGSSPIHEINPGDTQSCFEFEYRDNVWVLVSELDRENEPYNALLIEDALRKQ